MNDAYHYKETINKKPFRFFCPTQFCSHLRVPLRMDLLPRYLQMYYHFTF